jgi:hypothetical protein
LVRIRMKYRLLGVIHCRFEGAMIFNKDKDHIILIASG